MERVILHCDLNNFFASVSLLYNQTLVDSPIAVCGSVEQRHGIVLAKNELAKSYGVKTAEAIWEAKRKCPNLITLPPLYDKYEEFSEKAKDIYRRYTDMIEPFGIDECWLDVTGSQLLFGSGESIADKIRLDIKRELGITISVGVSFNKVFAKLGSDMKKPDGITVITRENFKEKVWPLPVQDLLFVGRRTVDKLNGAGVFTIGDLTLCDDTMLKRLFGKVGLDLKQYAKGLDNSPVYDRSGKEAPKSIGRSVTRGEDFINNDDVWQTFIILAEDIAGRLKRYNLYASTVQVHTRNTDLEIKEFSITLPNPTDISIKLAKTGMELFKDNYFWDLPLRSVGLRATNLKSEYIAEQVDMFYDDEQDKKQEILEDSIYSIRKKFGEDMIKRATVVEKEESSTD